MKAFGNLVNSVATKLQVLSTDFYATKSIPVWVQERYKKIWDSDNWNDICGTTYQAVIAANGVSFVLPKQYAAVLKAYNYRTGGPISIRDFVTFGDDAFTIVTNLNPTNDFTTMARMATQGVYTQLTSAQTVKILSSSTLDKGVTIYVSGLDSNGELIAESIVTNASNGTTPVVSTKTYTTISKISKTLIPTAGIITLTDASNASLGTIGSWETSPEYRVYRLNGVTSQQSQIQTIVKLAFVPMTNNFDVPFMEMDKAIIYGACADAWEEHRQIDLAAEARTNYEAAMADMRMREFEEEGEIYCLPLLDA